MLKTPIVINCSNVDSSRHLSLPAFFRLVEDFDTLDAEQIGAGKSVSMDQGRLWVFTRVYFEFYRYPAYLDKAVFTTYSSPKAAFVFPRHDELRDPDGNLLVKGTSYWALLDEKTRHAVFRPDFDTPDYRRGDELPGPGKVTPKNCRPVREHLVVYSDVDLNNHLNNTRYIEMIVDSLGAEFLSKHEVATLLINYDAEIRLGEKVVISASDDLTYLKGMVGERECFQAELTYRKRP